MKIFLSTIFLLTFLSFFSFTHAVEFERNTDSFYVMAQIIQRDNDGNLITYIETDSPVYVNLKLIDFLLDSIATKNDPIFTVGEYNFQTVTRITPLSTDESGLLSTIQYFMIDSNGRAIIIAQFAHDGMRLNDDEMVEVRWTFVRFV